MKYFKILCSSFQTTDDACTWDILKHWKVTFSLGSPYCLQHPVVIKVTGREKIWCRSYCYQTILLKYFFFFFLKGCTYSISEICMLICLYINVQLYTVYIRFTGRTEQKCIYFMQKIHRTYVTGLILQSLFLTVSHWGHYKYCFE